MIKKNDAETAPTKSAIWDEFREQHQHQSIKSTIFNAQLALIWFKKGADVIQIFVDISARHLFLVIF